MTKPWLAITALAVGFVFFICLISVTQAEEAPIISNTQVTISNGNSAYAAWNTNVTTAGVLEYGTSTGQYDQEISSAASATAHAVSLNNLSYDTTYYYQITATTSGDQTARSEEMQFTTGAQDLKITELKIIAAGSDKAIIGVTTNYSANTVLKYGLTAEALSNELGRIEVTSGYGSATSTFTLINLNPETTYYFQAEANQYVFWHQRDDTAVSEIASVTTTGLSVITGVSPDRGPTGTQITLTGRGFGAVPSQQFQFSKVNAAIGVGCSLAQWPTVSPSCLGRIVSWSDTEIVAVVEGGTTGQVTVAKSYVKYSDMPVNLFTIVGPVFTVAGRGQPAANAVEEKYGCRFSATVSDEQTVRIPGLFLAGDSTDAYLGRVYQAYQDEWQRVPRCDELQFHFDHQTPLDRLVAWLKNNPQTAAADLAGAITGPVMEFAETDSAIVLKDPLVTPTFGVDDLITFRGRTAANSLVALTIASDDPTTYTTTSDADGQWHYTLTGPLPAGEHTVTISVYDQDNQIIRLSQALAFTVKPTSATADTTRNTDATVDTTPENWPVYYVIVLVGALLVITTLLVLWFVMKKNSASKT